MIDMIILNELSFLGYNVKEKSMTSNSNVLNAIEIIMTNPLIDFAYLFGSRAKNTDSEISYWI